MTSTPAQAPHPVIRAAKTTSGQAGRKATAPTIRARRSGAGAIDSEAIRIELAAATIAVSDDEPVVEVIVSAGGRELDRLPSAPFRIAEGLMLDEALRGPVEAQTGHRIGYLQQLITFVGAERSATAVGTVMMIGYLALVHDRRGRSSSRKRVRATRWQGCYQHLPWEDWRTGRPMILEEAILPRLGAWARSGQPGLSRAALTRLQGERSARVRLAFAGPGGAWDEDKVLVRFDLLAEAGLIAEDAPPRSGSKRRPAADHAEPDISVGRSLHPGHRRILAAGIGRLRADLKTRPVVFELMDEAFSLYELQQTVEAILGPNLHKQNFRRLIETTGLVEPTGQMKSHTGGRPAKLYRFRRDVLLERPAPGLKIRT